jgi:hypothetical protein
MSLSINEVVNVNVNIGPAPLGRANFGVTAIFDGSNEVPGFAEYTSYSSLAEASSSQEVLDKGSAYFGEIPSPSKLVVFGYDQASDTDGTEAITEAINQGLWFYWAFFASASFQDLPDSTLNALEANSKFHIGDSIDEGSVDSGTSTDAGSRMQALQNRHTSAVFSRDTNHQAGIRIAARWASVDFQGLNTVPTMEHKVIAQAGDNFTATENAILLGKGYLLNTAVASKGSGVPSSLYNTRTYSGFGEWIDDVVGTDALVADLQSAVFNALRTQPAKLKYTPAGQQGLIASASLALEAYVANGFLGERVITDIVTGEVRLTRGYEIWTRPEAILFQSSEDRDAREASALNISIYRAGAIHSVTINLNVE